MSLEELKDHFSEKFGVVDYGEFMISNGRMLHVLDPKPDDIHIGIIAKSLSRLCRFNGHTREFYSVAQHSVLVSRNLSPRYALAGLLHDASEAFLGDLIRPIKILPQMEIYCEAEKLWQRTIFEYFRLDPEMPKAVKFADNRMLMTEFRDLFPRTPGELEEWGVEPYEHFSIRGVGPDAAYALFADRWEELTGSRKGFDD